MFERRVFANLLCLWCNDDRRPSTKETIYNFSHASMTSFNSRYAHGHEKILVTIHSSCDDEDTGKFMRNINSFAFKNRSLRLHRAFAFFSPK